MAKIRFSKVILCVIVSFLSDIRTAIDKRGASLVTSRGRLMKLYKGVGVNDKSSKGC